MYTGSVYGSSAAMGTKKCTREGFSFREGPLVCLFSEQNKQSLKDVLALLVTLVVVHSVLDLREHQHKSNFKKLP